MKKITDTVRFEALVRYDWRVLKLHTNEGYGVFGDAHLLIGSGITPRAAVDDAILRMEADLSVGRDEEEAVEADGE